jgi:hypothetical protein
MPTHLWERINIVRLALFYYLVTIISVMSLEYISATEALEEQAMLLQSLAMKENAAKDLGDTGLRHLVYADLERTKKDTCTMLQDVRDGISKRAAYNSHS